MEQCEVRRFSRRMFALLLLTLVPGCERVIDLTLSEGPRKLVVQARLERVLGAVNGSQSITLTTTSDYFSGAAPPPARGATVTVTSDLGVTTVFAESAVPGVYTTSSLTVARGRKYTLRILFDGQQYEATEATMPVPVISRLYFDDAKPGRYSDGNGIRATIDFTDRPNERNYYLWDQYVNGVRQRGPDETETFPLVASDDGYDGLKITGFQPFEGVNIPPLATVLIRQYALSEAVYHYYFALADQLNADGSPFAVPPASLRGNVENRTTINRPAAGYFYVSEVAEARSTYQPKVLSAVR